MNLILAIDPGPEQSAYLYYSLPAKQITGMGIVPNHVLREALPAVSPDAKIYLVVEMVACYGMAVGKEVFDTCVWIGRFVEAFGGEHVLIPRLRVKQHLCHDSRAKDTNIRQALIDRFGPGKKAAIGAKKNPGPLYGVKKDLWAALALAVTFADTELIGMEDYPKEK